MGFHLSVNLSVIYCHLKIPQTLSFEIVAICLLKILWVSFQVGQLTSTVNWTQLCICSEFSTGKYVSTVVTFFSWLVSEDLTYMPGFFWSDKGWLNHISVVNMQTAATPQSFCCLLLHSDSLKSIETRRAPVHKTLLRLLLTLCLSISHWLM